MPDMDVSLAPPRPREAFCHPDVTATGARRAAVPFTRLETVWFNTGTLCNITCAHCYIDSSPRNDRLVYLSAAEVGAYLDECQALAPPPREVGFTGGEPFMNPACLALIEEALKRGFAALVLTNAMQPMQRVRIKKGLVRLNNQYGNRLCLRVSLDHHGAELHERERGAGTWQTALDGLLWLAENGFRLSIAGRTCWGEDEAAARAGYAALFRRLGLALDAFDPADLVLFPEMDENADVPEITEECWGILGRAPEDMMCATSRMVIKRKGAAHPVVVSCTLLPYDERFELGRSLKGSFTSIALNHPHCARFCALGGASCANG